MCDVQAITSRDKEIIRGRMLSYVEEITPTHYKSLAWKKAAEDILSITDYNYPYDSLRQNLDSQNKSRGKPPREIQNPIRWQVLKEFLTAVGYWVEVDASLLPPSDFSKNDLRQLLSFGQNENDSNLFKNMFGVFEGAWEGEETFETITLVIDLTSDKDGVHVAASIECYHHARDVEVKESYAGIAVARNNFYLFMLCNKANGKMRSYTLLQSSPALRSDEKITDVALVAYSGALPGSLHKKTQHLGNDEVNRSEEPHVIYSYSLTPINHEPIIFLTRKEFVFMKKPGETPKGRGRHFVRPRQTEIDRERLVMGHLDLKNPDIDTIFIIWFMEGEYEKAFEILPQVKDINVKSPASRCTALHYAAARNERELIERLEQRSDLNYVVKNTEGLYPSDLAIALGENWELSRELSRKERTYAKENGVQLFSTLDNHGPG